MLRPKIQILFNELTKEVKKAEGFVKKTKTAAQEIAQAAAASPSQSGDREHSKNQAYIAQDFLTELKALLTKVKNEIQKETPTKVEGICFIKISFDDGRENEYYLTSDPVKLDKINFISEGSPLGKALNGKGLNSHFELKDPSVSGKIIELG